MQTLHTAYCINWTEYERGWGQRPDGHTLHRNLATAQDYLLNYWSKMPKNVPDEYSRPDKPFLVEVTEEQFKALEEAGSIWGHPTRCLPEPETV